MKVFKITLIVFIVLFLVLTAGLAIFLATFDINRYKSQIVSQAGKVLQRSVDFEKAKLAVSLRQGVNLRVSNLVISDDPAFSKGAFLTIQSAALSVDVLAYILRKQVNVSGITIDGFRVTLIRQKDGSLNAASIAQPSVGVGNGENPASAPAPMALPAIFITSVQGTNGALTYIDRSFEPPVQLEVSDLNITLTKFSLVDAFPFVAEAAVLSARKNIRVEGKAQVNLKTNEVTLSDVHGGVDLAQLLLEQIPTAFPMAKNMPLPLKLQGAARFNAEKMTAGPAGLVFLAGDISVADGLLQFKQLALPVKNVLLHAKVTQAQILFDAVSASIGDGTIKGTGSLDDYFATQKFTMALNADNLKLEDLISADMLPVKAQGLAACRLQVQGAGFTQQALASGLSGAGSATAKNIVLKDVNVFRSVLGKVSVIPGLMEKIEAVLPDKYKQALTQKDTALSDIELPVTIENSRLIIKDMTVSAEAFLINGRTELGFDGAYSLEGSFLIPADLSAAMVVRVPELQYILNETQQILIPVKVRGKAPEIKLSVDAAYMAQKLFTNQAKTELLKVIDKALGSKSQNPASSNTPSQ
jgi:uncharacterized protein involved in outer membrane biogenesis